MRIILITINQNPLYSIHTAGLQCAAVAHTRLGARIMTSCETGIYSVISCKLSGVPRGVFFYHVLSHTIRRRCHMRARVPIYIIYLYIIIIICSVIFLLRGNIFTASGGARRDAFAAAATIFVVILKYVMTLIIFLFFYNTMVQFIHEYKSHSTIFPTKILYSYNINYIL